MIKIYNTLKQKKERFISINKKKVNMYVCGMTVYDRCHIGHGRTFTIFDIILRYLKYCGYKVFYVRNITDIDDKIIKKAKLNKESIQNLTTRMIDKMRKDFFSLNILPPDKEPKVTDHIDDIIKLISFLVEKKYAYIAKNGDVVFSIKKYINYGKLSNQFFDKKIFHENDFTLWKLSKPLEPKWKSPWGWGRPGWHIECSAINQKYLGNNFDIHGGGIDLIFPHHENEIAQSACSIKNFNINYWIHTGMVMINNKKMSKSKHNFFTIKDVLSKFDAETIRYFFISNHYRSPLHYNEKNLYQAKISLQRLYLSLRNINFKNISNIYEDIAEVFEKKFCNAMNDDFNTPKAYSVLFSIANKINKMKNKNKNIANALAIKLKKLGKILGILNHDAEFFLQANKNYLHNKYYIEKLINIRFVARKKKQWEIADKIRNKLKKLGILIEDNKRGTLWRKK